MFCENCGKQLPDGSKFCDGCGNKVEAQANEMSQPANSVNSSNGMANPVPPPQQQNYNQYQQNATPGSGQYAQGNYSQGMDTRPLTVGQYIGMFLLMAIPFVNIILLFVWGFGSTVNLNKKNWAKATLILMLVGVVFYIIIGATILGALGSIFGGGMYY